MNRRRGSKVKGDGLSPERRLHAHVLKGWETARRIEPPEARGDQPTIRRKKAMEGVREQSTPEQQRASETTSLRNTGA